MKIGFIGLGHMGTPMVENLLKHNHEVMVFDLQKEACQPLVEQGATCADSGGAVARDADVVFTMLQTHEQVSECCVSEHGVFAQLNAEKALFIDCSTVDINASRQLHQQAKQQGIAMLDAPVSGGVAAAKAASLTFMVGGEPQYFKQAEPLLRQLGKVVIHAGAAGNGTAAKICNNMVLGVSMIAICESFNLAKELGLPAEKLYEICSQASGQCWSLTSYCPEPGILENAPSNNNYQPGFAAKMMLKDLKLSQQAARGASVQVPLGEHATALYQHYVEQGHQDTDFSGIIQMLARAIPSLSKLKNNN